VAGGGAAAGRHRRRHLPSTQLPRLAMAATSSAFPGHKKAQPGCSLFFMPSSLACMFGLPAGVRAAQRTPSLQLLTHIGRERLKVE
jgi:hypothetical protein